MKLEILDTEKGFAFTVNENIKVFYPLKITKSFMWIESSKVAYPTKNLFSIYNGEVYLQFVDKNGTEFSITDCLQFTNYQILETTYNIKEIEQL